MRVRTRFFSDLAIRIAKCIKKMPFSSSIDFFGAIVVVRQVPGRSRTDWGGDMTGPIGRIVAACTAAAALTGLGSAAQASPLINFSTLTCGEFLSATEEGQQIMTLWLDGYLSTNPDLTRVELDLIMQNAPLLSEACQDRSDAKVAGIYETQERQRMMAREPGND